MPQNAWPLLVFTLLSQMNVGAYCIAEFLNLIYLKEFSAANLRTFPLFTRLFVLVTAVLAGISSIFHLKNLAHAYHAFNNLKTSWLSKEMAFFFLFFTCVALLALMSWRKIGGHLLQRIIAMVGVLCGSALIFSMAKIYMLPTVPVWNAWTTPVLFFTTALILGTLVVICLYDQNLASSESLSKDDIRRRWSLKTRPKLVKFLLIFIVIGICVTVFFAYRSMRVTEGFSPDTLGMGLDTLMLLFIRISMNILGGALLFLYLKRSQKTIGFSGKSPNLVYIAFILITLAEIIGRYLFYVSFHRIGL